MEQRMRSTSPRPQKLTVSNIPVPSLPGQQIKHVMSERNVLLKNLQHPFVVGLYCSFQTPDKLYFVLDYVNGGELFFHLQVRTNMCECACMLLLRALPTYTEAAFLPCASCDSNVPHFTVHPANHAHGPLVLCFESHPFLMNPTTTMLKMSR